ncbi:MAG: hypothetical protein O7J95_17615 [Planctomycetota bacterium]|nr:hypothetical protein [Planctomycetota bacterium]
MRLLPYLLAFAAGFVVGVLLLRRFEGGSSSESSEWEKKYRELLTHYRDLTRRRHEDCDPEEGRWRDV